MLYRKINQRYELFNPVNSRLMYSLSRLQFLKYSSNKELHGRLKWKEEPLKPSS